jgi:syringomycin synthetase protein SyrB1
LKQRATSDLPDYMRPSAYVVLSALPLTAHGKLDKDALPSPESAAWVLGGSVATASQASSDIGLSEEEAGVLSVWRDRLGLKGIGLHDDFFDFGGTSLALIRSLSEIRSRYRIELDLAVLAKGATAKVLADFIRGRRGEAPFSSTEASRLAE